MKKKLAIILIVALAFTFCTASVAYAAPGDNGNQGSNIQDKIDKAQERLEFLETVQPLIGEMAQNRSEIASLSTQLREKVNLAKEHVVALRNDIDNVTDEQLAKLKELKTQLSECRTQLAQTNVNMCRLRQQIRTGRWNGDYDSIASGYNGVIALQEQRIEILNKMIQLNEQIC